MLTDLIELGQKMKEQMKDTQNKSQLDLENNLHGMIVKPHTWVHHH